MLSSTKYFTIPTALKLGIFTGLIVMSLVRPTSIKAVEETNAQNTALAISPAILEAILDPGESRTIELTLSNQSSVPIPIKAEVSSFIELPENLSEEEMERFDISSWIQVEQSDFILSANQQKRIRIFIEVPSDASPGGHYATVYFRSLIPKSAVSPENVYLTSNIGALTFLIVKGDIIESLEYGDLEGPSFLQFGPIDLTLPVSNQGNVHNTVSGTFTVKDIFGSTVHSSDIVPSIVLPGSTKILPVLYPKKLLLGRYEIETISPIIDQFGQSNIVTRTKSIWVFPWTVLLVFGILTGIAIWSLTRGKYKFALVLKILRSNANNLDRIKEI